MKHLCKFTAAFLTAVLLFDTVAGADTAHGTDWSAAARAEAESRVEALLADDMSDMEKLLVLHDSLDLSCVYNPLDTATCNTADGSLLKGRAVCRGYADGYALLADTAGLDGFYVYSEALEHAWTVVTLDGHRYFTDATWDDTRPPCIGYVKHTWFLFSDATAELYGHTGRDLTDISVEGGAFENPPFLQAVTRVVIAGEYLYYINEAFELIACRRDTWETQVLLRVKTRWSLSAEAGTYRDGTYTGLVWLDGRLWFNTPTHVLSFEPAEKTVRVEYTHTGADGELYGLDVRNGTLTVCAAADPSADVYTLIDTGIDASAAWGYCL